MCYFLNMSLELSDFYKFIHMSQISTAVLNSKFVAIYHTIYITIDIKRQSFSIISSFLIGSFNIKQKT